MTNVIGDIEVVRYDHALGQDVRDAFDGSLPGASSACCECEG